MTYWPRRVRDYQGATVTPTLSDWLLAQIAEDEAVARACEVGVNTWEVGEPDLDAAIDAAVPWTIRHPPISNRRGQTGWFVVGRVFGGDRAEHVARHDPARVLAECEAKRGAIEAAWRDHCQIESEWGRSQSREQMSAEDDNPEVLCWLALPYADRPGYREEWRP